LIKDRGMKKWQGMMLPEQVALLNEYFGEKKKVYKNVEGWRISISRGDYKRSRFKQEDNRCR